MSPNTTDPRIVENSYYDHETHGRVKAVAVTDDEVGFEVCGETVTLPGGSTVPKARREPLEAFAEATEPAPVTVSAPATDPAVTVNPPN